MSPALSTDELTALEEAVQQALATGDDSRLEVVGYGEITAVVAWMAAGRPVACKRLPGLADEAAFKAYAACIASYIDRLASNGIEVPATAVQHVVQANGSYTAYSVQAMLPESSLLNRHLAACDRVESLEIFETLVESVAASITDRLGIDAQLSNWALDRDRLAYIDITTPFIRDEHGQEMFDVELHISSAPWVLQALVRTFFLDAILDKYYTVRGALLDLLGNMIKERLEVLLPAFVEVANRVVSPPFTVAEIEKYYRGDARMWALLQALRRADRWWQRTVRRRPYPFLLPKDLPR
jgi:hypothetical protein